jgi:hypothetical protein
MDSYVAANPRYSERVSLGVVVQLKDAFNTVWEVSPDKHSGLWGFIRTYILSLAGVMAIDFLLLISMLLTAALAAFGKYFGSFVPEAALQAVGLLVSFRALPKGSIRGVVASRGSYFRRRLVFGLHNQCSVIIQGFSFPLFGRRGTEFTDLELRSGLRR